MSDYWGRKVLDATTGKAALPSITAYLALYTAAPTDAGGGTEVSGNAYQRVTTAAANWNSAGGSAPCTTSNGQILVFPQATPSGWGSIVAAAIFDALTGGDLIHWDYIGNFTWKPFTCSSASPGVIDCPGHGLANGDQIVVSAEFGGTLPTLSAGSWSGLQTVAGVSGDTFNVGLNTTSTGNGMLRKVVPITVNANNTPIFDVNQYNLSLA